MKQTLRCSCGYDVPFEEEDRGFEVYCPSCARACEVPSGDAGETVGENAAKKEIVAAGESANSSKIAHPAATGSEAVPDSAVAADVPENSVFSASAFGAIGERVIDHVQCLCGERIPVRVEEIGLAVYCPKCGAENQTGASIGQPDSSDATGETSQIGEQPLPPTPQAHVRWIRSPAGIIVAGLMAVFLAVTGYLTWDHRSEVLEWAGAIEPIGVPQVSADGPVEFDPDRVTSEAIEELIDMEDAFEALMFAVGWRTGLCDCETAEDDPRIAQLDQMVAHIVEQKRLAMRERIQSLPNRDDVAEAFEQAQNWMATLRACDLPADDSLVNELEAVGRQLVETAHPITNEMIRALLDRSDSEDALMQAQLWQEELRERRTPDDDPRWAQLDKTVQTLLERLIPPPAEHVKVIDEFRGLVDQLYEQIRDKRYAAAEKTKDQIERRLKEHPDVLSSLTKRFLGLKAKLQGVSLRREGLSDIRRLLEDSNQLLDEGRDEKVSEAWRFKAMAAFLARRVPMRPEQAQQLRELSQQLNDKLRFARGRRAVADAKQCNQANDRFARNREVRRALKLLPGLPESKVAPLLDDLKEWTDAAKASADRPASTSISDVGKQIERRNLFEEALTPYGNSDGESLGAAGRAYHESLVEAERSTDRDYAKLQEMLFEVLEVNLVAIMQEEQGLPPDQLEQQLLKIRATLAGAEVWHDSPRWKTVDGALRQAGEMTAKKTLQRAIDLSENNQIEEALQAVESAVVLGGTETAVRARNCKEAWHKELKIRADRAAEAASLARIRHYRQERQVAECWKELKLFVRLFPNSEHLDEVKQMQDQIQAYYQREFDRQVSELKQLANSEDWPSFFPQLKVLEDTASTDQQRDAFAGLRKIADHQEHRIEQGFHLLGTRAKMYSEEDVLAVRKVVSLMLAVDPQNVEAQRLLEQSLEKGAKRAKKHVDGAEKYMHLEPEGYRDVLRRAIKLDPVGPHGKRALELLRNAS